MEYRSNEIKAGCFVGISIILLIATLFVVSGLDLFKSTKIYRARFKYTSGIEVGSIVRYGGMEVGTIKEVKIADDDNSCIDFLIEIDENVPVKEDSKVFITSIGIMGEYYIEISTGSVNSKLVPPGSLLNSKDITPLMMLTDTVDELTEQLSETISGINRLLGSENQVQVHKILANLNGLLENNQNTFNSMMENMNSLLAKVNKMGDTFDTLLQENQGSIAGSIRQLESTLQQSQLTIKQFQSTIENVNQMLASQNGNYDEIMKNLNRTSRNLDEFTRTIKEQPWSLVRKSTPKERKIK